LCFFFSFFLDWWQWLLIVLAIFLGIGVLLYIWTRLKARCEKKHDEEHNLSASSLLKQRTQGTPHASGTESPTKDFSFSQK
jgi:hypothetical protein